ncbi:MAG: GldG family protein [Defluviitaleaceae bacterium]|nr:GldG family protein [Defluviitaleaceae bacterium]
MKKIIQSFKNKKFRYGAFSTLIAAAVIAVLIMTAAVFDRLNIRFDMTQNRFFALSPQTMIVLGLLDEDISIYTLFPTGQENIEMTEILNQYAAHSGFITLANRDPIIHRAFVDQFVEDGRDIPNNSVIVTGPGRSRVIPASDIFIFEFDANAGSTVPAALNIEPMVTNALTYLMRKTVYKLYEIEGNNNIPLPPEFIDLMRHAGYEHNTLNLIMEDIPADADVISLATPQRDISPEEARKIIEYLDTGGRALLMIDINPGMPMPNLHSVVESFGVALNGFYVHEGDTSRHWPQQNRLIFPQVAQHEINSRIIENGASPLLLESQGIGESPLRRTFLTVEPLLVSTSASFGRNNPHNTAINQAPGEPSGPFPLAAAIEDFFTGPSGTYNTKIVLIGTSNIADNTLNQQSYGANGDFLIGSLDWLVNRTDGGMIFIQPKSLRNDSFLMLTQAEQNNIMVFSLWILPGVIAAAGIAVWLKRRNM